MVGTEVVVDVGAAAHGGHAVARLDEPAPDASPGTPARGRVVFVRHALPGERVRARVTEGRPGDSFWRADAIEVLRASPDRVSPPCPLAVPGGCGGCDLQHASLDAQRRWKADVVTDLLTRIGRLPVGALPPLVVEALPGPGADGLGWRGRLRFAVAADGTVGLRQHRGHRVVPVRHCPIASPAIDALDVTRARWPGTSEIALATGDDNAVVAVALTAAPTDPPGTDPDLPATTVPTAPTVSTVPPVPTVPRVPTVPTVPPAQWSRPDGVGLVLVGADGATTRRGGRSWVSHTVDGVEGSFRVGGAGFWQAHPGAATTYVQAVRDALAPRPGDHVVDLYSGSGLFAAALADDVGPTGSVLAVEGDGTAVADARRNLHARSQVQIVESDVAAFLAGLAGDPRSIAGVVLDPPRAGAGHPVVDAICALAPAAVAYVACDPAALARDVARFATHGYALTGLRAFDAFPMTHHVECVATLTAVSTPPPASTPVAVGQDEVADTADVVGDPSDD